MKPPIPTATAAPRWIAFTLVAAAASASVSMIARRHVSPASVARPTKRAPRTSPARSPVPPIGIAVYHRSLLMVRDRIAPADGVVRDLHVAVRAMWRLANASWVPQESSHETIVVPAHGTRAITDLVGTGLANGTYAAQLTINDRLECYRFALPERSPECGSNPRAGLADPAPPSECTGRGFLEQMRPENGTGVMTLFLEDSRISEQVHLRDGHWDGVAVQYFGAYDGEPTHRERTFEHDVLTLSRSFDLDGHQLNELPYSNGRAHGTFHAWNSAGEPTEEAVWNHGALVSMRTLDGHGHVISAVDYGMPGRDHGTYCRPDHRCSQW